MFNKTQPTKQEVIDWGVQEEAKRIQGIYFSNGIKNTLLMN